LITYSNRAFYAGKLITYAGALEVAPDLGVELFHVPDGVYERGGARDNPIEARAVVERVIFHAENHRDLTCGVVAFSEAQASRIGWELEAFRRGRPDLDEYFHGDRLDGFFVKNLENVQGDERDIIIFSIGYGFDEAGKITMNFGPINRDGGQRRLNVAVTRAKRRVEVVSSIKAQDIRETNSIGVKHLKGYLDFAERGPVALMPVEQEVGGEPESPFEESVIDVIRGWGHEVVSQVGQAGYRIDMAIRDPANPGRYVLGIECDGAAYHSSAVARDRDRLRQQVLEGLGWRMYRIWGPSWYRDQPGEEARLQAAIGAALAGDDGGTEVEVGGDRPVVELEGFDIDGLPDWVTEYEVAKLEMRWGTTGLDDPTNRRGLQLDITRVVAAEGPVMDLTVLERLRNPWRVKRMTDSLRRAFAAAVEAAVQQGQVVRPTDGVLCAPGQDPFVVRAPRPGDDAAQRKVAAVPIFELVAALEGVVREAARVDEVELTTRVARIFGWNRRGSDITAALASALAVAVADERIRRTEGGLLELGA